MISSTWRTPWVAWQWACNTIAAKGDLVKTEDGKLTKEVCNLAVEVLEPGQGWPVPASGWDLPALDRYAAQLMNPDNTGFDYTYGNRLRAHPAIFDDPDSDISIMEWDQIQIISGKLKRFPTSRRGIAITWHPEIDIVADHAPCLQLVDFLFRGGQLNMTAFFRSWDVSRAAPANMYGLSKLLGYVAKEAGMKPGSLTIVAASAHIYEA